MSVLNNDVLTSVALMEKVIPYLHDDSRMQINRSELSLIKQLISQASFKLNNSGVGDVYTLGVLIDVSTFLSTLLDDSTYTETDTETKDMIAAKLIDVLNKLYIMAGKYYTTNEFDFSMRLQPLLDRIINHCLTNGYYFGKEL